jgi:hypothetical protein
MKYLIWTIIVSGLFIGCQDKPIKFDDTILDAGARTVQLNNVSNEVLEQAFLPLLAPEDMGFFSHRESKKTVSNLGNGRYFKYLNLTHSLVDNELYEEDVVKARQVCIQAMISTHYLYSKPEVLEETESILSASILLEKELLQVNSFLEALQAEKYNEEEICFECE